LLAALLCLAVPTPSSRADPPAEPSGDALYLRPNVQDADGAWAYVHFEARDMPLRVSVETPRQAALHASTAQTRDALIEGLRLWERALASAVPAFRLEISEDDPDAQVRVVWKRRMSEGVAGRGSIAWSESDGVVRATGSIEYTTQTCLATECRLQAAELTLVMAHEFGHALGLGHCLNCDSIMSYAWETRKRTLVTDLDVRTFQALWTIPNGQRTDGGRLGSGAR
jgi:hypothetical protein